MKKIDGTKNGYMIDDSSTNEKWQEICKQYEKIRCIICNKNTRKYFTLGILGQNDITINNNVPDKVVYINNLF